MQMKTRSTTRAEAARLKVSTRSQARAAMAPPPSKFGRHKSPVPHYKCPRQKARKPDAQNFGSNVGLGTSRNLASPKIEFITADEPSKVRHVSAQRNRPSFERPKQSSALSGHEAKSDREGSARNGRQMGGSGSLQVIASMPEATPWTTLSLFSEDHHSQATLGLIDQGDRGEEFLQSKEKRRRAQKLAEKIQSNQHRALNNQIQHSCPFGDTQSTFSGVYSFGGVQPLHSGIPLLNGVNLGKNSVVSRWTQGLRTAAKPARADADPSLGISHQSLEVHNKIDEDHLLLPSQAQIEVNEVVSSQVGAAIVVEKPQLTSLRRSVPGETSLVRPVKRVRISAHHLHKRALTLKKVGDPSCKLVFDLYKDEQLPFSTWTRHSAIQGSLREEENDYDSDSDQIQKAQEKLRREMRLAIGEELDKGLQGLFTISDFAACQDAEGEPLSQRLRKRKLNSA